MSNLWFRGSVKRARLKGEEIPTSSRRAIQDSGSYQVRLHEPVVNPLGVTSSMRVHVVGKWPSPIVSTRSPFTLCII